MQDFKNPQHLDKMHDDLHKEIKKVLKKYGINLFSTSIELNKYDKIVFDATIVPNQE